EYQLNDSTPTPLLDGIEDICSYFSSIPQGIVSQNARSNILNSLQSNGLAGYFRHVVGYEEVPLIKQKPEPNGLILCLKKLTEMKSGITFYIGDHQTDTHCAVKANQILQKDYPGISILSIGAFYSTHADDTGWQIKPDFTAFYPEDIVKIIGSYQEQV
ncbi:MAG: HAD hydrolase-like protein, partial [Aliifodinibius sp.]|nr:HAD family hydrolase [Fodinibius sp.]NIV12598.1 HAD hydrolase-like protein [Fodinibius sp.]NIY26304.1 HAD hydrolase-like protein [Fodinibius sp.]